MDRLNSKIKEFTIIFFCVVIGMLGGYLANRFTKEKINSLEYVEYPSITGYTMGSRSPIYDSIYNCDQLLRLGYDLRDTLNLLINDAGTIAKLTDIYLTSFMDKSAILSQKPYHIRRINTIWDINGNDKKNKVHLMLSGKTGAILRLKQE